MIFSLASLISFIVFLLPLTALAFPTAPASELEGRAGKAHRVIVGIRNKPYRYHPQYVNANLGDIIQFEFHPENHSTTESTFHHPCRLIPNRFDTGFIYIPHNQTMDFPYFEYEVTDKKPHWFHCHQVGHCRAGMVFAVNPPKTGRMTFAKFQWKAMQDGN
ncbi:hypothetical protein FRC07_002239 [Ceratobasidium sp. 392]|nr:hypothetical protein FRC07_002239 [Ceratobasidium sp. 392]